jgi:hypothetical protein
MAPKKNPAGLKLVPQKTESVVDGTKIHLDGTDVTGETREDLGEQSLALVVKKFTLGQLVTNALDIKAIVQKKLELYQGKDYKGDIAEAKKDRATLNKAEAQLNQDRLDYEKKWLEPFDAFKVIVNETRNEIKDVVSVIDSAIKAKEQAEKDDKKKLIQDFFDKQGITLFTLDSIFKNEWLNKTASMKSIEAEITARKDKINSELAILDRLNEPEAKAHYLDTLDLSSALSMADRLKANRQKLEAAKAYVEPTEEDTAESQGGEFDGQLGEEEGFDAGEDEPEETHEPATGPQPAPEPAALPILSYNLTIGGTKPKLFALMEYMKANGITYKRIEVSEGDGY